MSKHDPELTLRQILRYAQEAIEISQGKTRPDLDQERLLNLALTRLIEMLGEAANRVPEEVRNQYPDLPWLPMIAARNRLIHGYDSVDFDILWSITQNDLPNLITRLKEILQAP
ncbi:MAG TPA: HepT-like ribonuclease domain-containing protein [Anaerolineales bacterium]|nr:HepT-like ribonuclease domain-containing protein [Anaerolineales bacterium]